MIEAGREINFFRIILNKFKNKTLYELYKICFSNRFLKIFIKKQFKTYPNGSTSAQNFELIKHLPYVDVTNLKSSSESLVKILF